MKQLENYSNDPGMQRTPILVQSVPPVSPGVVVCDIQIGNAVTEDEMPGPPRLRQRAGNQYAPCGKAKRREMENGSRRRQPFRNPRLTRRRSRRNFRLHSAKRSNFGTEASVRFGTGPRAMSHPAPLYPTPAPSRATGASGYRGPHELR